MSDRAEIEVRDGQPRWCAYPCQKVGEDGKRLQRKCRVSVDPGYAGKVWTLSGSPVAPTLSPSIDCQHKPCWHGFIIDGEVRP